MISQPACEMVFGDGIWDFRPKALYGIDAGVGETKLTDVDYRGNEGIIGMIPKAGKLFVFRILRADRMQELTSTRIGADPCTYVRVRANAQAATHPRPVHEPRTLPRRARRLPHRDARRSRRPRRSRWRHQQDQRCRARRRRSAARRCSRTRHGRRRPSAAMSDVRFKEAAIEGEVPNEQLAYRPARQRLRRPAHQGDGLRLRRRRHAAGDHLRLGSPGRAGAGTDLPRACEDPVAAPRSAAAAIAGATAGGRVDGAPRPPGHAGARPAARGLRDEEVSDSAGAALHVPWARERSSSSQRLTRYTESLGARGELICTPCFGL